MKLNIIIMLSAVTILLNSCAHNPESPKLINRSMLKQGMTKQQLISIYGQPNEINKNSNGMSVTNGRKNEFGEEVWKYKKHTSAALGSGAARAAGGVVRNALLIGSLGIVNIDNPVGSVGSAKSDILEIDFDLNTQRVIGWR